MSIVAILFDDWAQKAQSSEQAPDFALTIEQRPTVFPLKWSRMALADAMRLKICDPGISAIDNASSLEREPVLITFSCRLLITACGTSVSSRQFVFFD